MPRTIDLETTHTPPGWERTTHCGYLAFAKDKYTIYASPTRRGWVRALFLGNSRIPDSTKFFSRLSKAIEGL